MKKNIFLTILITISLFFIGVSGVKAKTTTCQTGMAIPVCSMTNKDNDKFSVRVCTDDNNKITTAFFIAVVDGKQYHYTTHNYSSITSGLNGGGTYSRNITSAYFSEKLVNNLDEMFKTYDAELEKTSPYCPTSAYYYKDSLCFQYKGDNYCEDVISNWKKKKTVEFDIVLGDPKENISNGVLNNIIKGNDDVKKKQEEGKLSFEIATDVTCDSLLGVKTNPDAPAYYVHIAFTWIKYIAIILLVVMSMKDFAFAVVSKDEEAIKKATSICIKRFIYCIVIFLLPIIVEQVMGWANLLDDPSICGL